MKSAGWTMRFLGQTFSMRRWQRRDNDSHKSHSRTAHRQGNSATFANAQVHILLGRELNIYQRVATSVLQL